MPLTLSKIIARLLIKAPEKRYQSANGLLADLIRCRDEYDATGAIGEFHLENTVYTRRVSSGPHFEVEYGNRILPDLDVEYLMRSSLAISAEIDRDTLQKKIMSVVIESSGAQHGYLLIVEDDALVIRAESHIGEKQAWTVNQNLDDAAGICKAIVRYVHRDRGAGYP